jgi:hypothetical protein
MPNFAKINTYYPGHSKWAFRESSEVKQTLRNFPECLRMFRERSGDIAEEK